MGAASGCGFALAAGIQYLAAYIDARKVEIAESKALTEYTLLQDEFVRSVQQIVAQKKSLKDAKEQELNEVAVTGLKTFSCAVAVVKNYANNYKVLRGGAKALAELPRPSPCMRLEH